MATFSNPTANNTAEVNPSLSGAGLTWDEATFAWQDGGDRTWDDAGKPQYTNTSKNSSTIANVTKN